MFALLVGRCGRCDGVGSGSKNVPDIRFVLLLLLVVGVSDGQTMCDSAHTNTHTHTLSLTYLYFAHIIDILDCFFFTSLIRTWL